MLSYAPMPRAPMPVNACERELRVKRSFRVWFLSTLHAVDEYSIARSTVCLLAYTHPYELFALCVCATLCCAVLYYGVLCFCRIFMRTVLHWRRVISSYLSFFLLRMIWLLPNYVACSFSLKTVSGDMLCVFRISVQLKLNGRNSVFAAYADVEQKRVVIFLFFSLRIGLVGFFFHRYTQTYRQQFRILICFHSFVCWHRCMGKLKVEHEKWHVIWLMYKTGWHKCKHFTNSIYQQHIRIQPSTFYPPFGFLRWRWRLRRWSRSQFSIQWQSVSSTCKYAHYKTLEQE